MNLLEILLNLQGKKSGERRRLLIEWHVVSELWPDIQDCFTQEGKLIRDGKPVEAIVVQP
jgi:hypothetical protein